MEDVNAFEQYVQSKFGTTVRVKMPPPPSAGVTFSPSLERRLSGANQPTVVVTGISGARVATYSDEGDIYRANPSGEWPFPVTVAAADSAGIAAIVAAQEATQAERARILAALEKIRPTEQHFSRAQWRWEEAGKRAMFDAVLKAVTAAIGGQEQKGGAE